MFTHDAATQTLLHIGPFTHTHRQTPLRKDALYTRKQFYAQTLAHTGALTRQRLFLPTLLHTDAKPT